MTEIDGVVRFEEIKGARHAVVFNPETAEEKTYLIPFGFRVRVIEGQEIKKGDKITDGALNPHDILDILGAEAVMNYLISEVQSTYRLQGVEINDKHIEVIVRQMMRRVKMEDPGSTGYMSGQMYDKNDVLFENEQIKSALPQAKKVCARRPLPRCCSVSPRQRSQPTASCPQHPSRRPPESSPTPLSRARLTRWSA